MSGSASSASISPSRFSARRTAASTARRRARLAARLLGGLLGLARLGGAGGRGGGAAGGPAAGGAGSAAGRGDLVGVAGEPRGARLPVARRREVVEQLAVVDLEHARGDAVDEMTVVGDQQDGAGVVLEGVGERLDRAHVEVVGGLVEQQEVGVADEQREQAEAAALAAREHLDALLDLVGAELEAAEELARLLLVVADQRQHGLAGTCPSR